MNLRHAIYLASRYLLHAPTRTATLVLALGVALFLPLFTWQAANLIESGLLHRANQSPMLVGAKGDRFDLTMSTLYFRGSVQSPIRFGERHQLNQESVAIPLHVGHTVQRAPLVGTEASYLTHRDLRVATGRPYALLGEVIAGAGAAERFDLQPGDTVRNDIQQATNLAGAYPHQLRVVGILHPTGSPDDEALFTSLPTTWMLDGHLHGHEAVTTENALDAPKDAEDEDEVLEATAAIFMIQEVSDETRAKFHFHGEQDDLDVSGFLVVPSNQRAHDTLLGDLALSEHLQGVRPALVVSEVLDILLATQRALNLFFVLVALSTGAFMWLILSLSLRLRSAEHSLIRRMGGSRTTIATLVTIEVLIVLSAATLFALIARWAAITALLTTLPSIG